MAFLHTIAAAEHGGTFNPASAYYSLNGKQTVNSLAAFPTSVTASSAAGAYQIVRGTYDGLANQLGLHDWSNSTQDRMRAFHLMQRGGIAALQSAYLTTAILDGSNV